MAARLRTVRMVLDLAYVALLVMVLLILYLCVWQPGVILASLLRAYVRLFGSAGTALTVTVLEALLIAAWIVMPEPAWPLKILFAGLALVLPGFVWWNFIRPAAPSRNDRP